MAKALELHPSTPPINDLELFIEEICVHQACARIMATEYNCSIEAGAHMAWLSEPYGLREFPYDAKDDRRVRWSTPLSDLSDDEDTPSDDDSKTSSGCRADSVDTEESNAGGEELFTGKLDGGGGPVVDFTTRRTRSMTGMMASGAKNSKTTPFLSQHVLLAPVRMS